MIYATRRWGSRLQRVGDFRIWLHAIQRVLVVCLGPCRGPVLAWVFGSTSILGSSAGFITWWHDRCAGTPMECKACLGSRLSECYVTAQARAMRNCFCPKPLLGLDCNCMPYGCFVQWGSKVQPTCMRFQPSMASRRSADFVRQLLSAGSLGCFSMHGGTFPLLMPRGEYGRHDEPSLWCSSKRSGRESS